MDTSVAFIFVALLCCRLCLSSQFYRDLDGFRLCKNKVPRRIPNKVKDSVCAHATIDSYRHVASCLKSSMPNMESVEMAAALCAEVVSTFRKNVSTPILTDKYLYV